MMGQVSRERLAALQVKGGDVIQVAIKGGKILLNSDQNWGEERNKNNKRNCNIHHIQQILSQLEERDK